MSPRARYRALLAWILKYKSVGQTRKWTRVVASKSTLDLPIRFKPTRSKRNQGNIEAVSGRPDPHISTNDLRKNVNSQDQIRAFSKARFNMLGPPRTATSRQGSPTTSDGAFC